MDHHVYTPRKKSKAWLTRIKVYGSLVLALGIAGGGLYVLREGDFFKLRTFTVVGVDEGAKEQLLDRVRETAMRGFWTAALGENHYLAWPDELAIEWPDFKSVTLEKKFFNRSVVITAIPRIRYGIWCLSGESGCFWFDRDDGMLLEPAPISEGQLISNIKDKERLDAPLGNPILPPEQFGRLITILERIKEFKFSITAIELYRSLEELHMVTGHGARLKFSLRFDPTPLIFNSLRDLLKENPLAAVEYIDFSVENRAYLKKK